MKRIRRPGYLAGYEPFGKTKGIVAQPPQPPPPQSPLLIATQLPPEPHLALALATPITHTPAQHADPAFLARIAALQGRVKGRSPIRPGVAPSRPSSLRPKLPAAEEDDED